MKKSNLQFYCAASVLLLIIGASILAPLLVTHNPFEPDMANRLQPPSWQHFFGTDALGRDMFSRILYGGRASILLSLASAILSLGVGLVIGLFCGFYGGKLDMLCTVASNIFQGIPGSCFMIAIAGIFGPSIKSLVLALVITSWAGFSRIVRAEVMQLKEEPFIEGLRWDAVTVGCCCITSFPILSTSCLFCSLSVWDAVFCPLPDSASSAWAFSRRLPTGA